MKPSCLSVFNYTVNSPSAGTLDVHIDGAIVDAETEQMYRDYLGDDTSVSYKSFRNSVNAASPSTLNIYLNSPGGLVTDALAIHDYLQALQRTGTTVNVYWRGIVASAATHIGVAVPAANRFASKNSFGLIHNVSGGAWGDLRAMQNYVKILEKFNASIVNLYTAQTNLSEKKIIDMMDAETLLTADELLQYGFVGSIDGEDVATNQTPVDRWNFRNKAILNVYNATPKPSQNPTPTIMEFSKITDAINTGFATLADKLGITNKTEGAKDALAGFADSIVNAMKESIPTDESVQKMVDATVSNSMAKAFEKLPENLTTAIQDAIKNTATAEDLNKLSEELDKTKASIANRTGGAGAAKPANQKPDASAKYDHPGVKWGDDDDDE